MLSIYVLCIAVNFNNRKTLTFIISICSLPCSVFKQKIFNSSNLTFPWIQDLDACILLILCRGVTLISFKYALTFINSIYQSHYVFKGNI